VLSRETRNAGRTTGRKYPGTETWRKMVALGNRRWREQLAGGGEKQHHKPGYESQSGGAGVAGGGTRRFWGAGKNALEPQQRRGNYRSATKHCIK
jgi:hypothetical protein